MAANLDMHDKLVRLPWPRPARAHGPLPRPSARRHLRQVALLRLRPGGGRMTALHAPPRAGERRALLLFLGP